LTAACITAVVLYFRAILEEQFINNNANLILLKHYFIFIFFSVKNIEYCFSIGIVGWREMSI